MSTERRFPPPWTAVEELERYTVYDGWGQKLAWIYFEDEPGRRRVTGYLTKDEARRIAKAISRLPELLNRS